MTRMNPLFSGCLLMLDRRFWLLMLLGLLLLVGGGHLGIATMQADGPPDGHLEAVGFEVTEPTVTEQVGDDSSLSYGMDGIFLREEQHVVNLSHRYEVELSEGSLDDVSLEVDLIIERQTSERVLWRYVEPLASHSVASPELPFAHVEVLEVNLDHIERQIERFDDRFGGRAGSPVVRVEATITRTDVETVTRIAELTIHLEDDLYHLEHDGVRLLHSQQERPGRSLSVPLSLLTLGGMLVVIPIGSRVLGITPLRERERHRHALRWLQTRHPKRFVAVETMVTHGAEVTVDTPRAMLHVARERRVPILVDEQGALLVASDGIWFVCHPPGESTTPP